MFSWVLSSLVGIALAASPLHSDGPVSRGVVQGPRQPGYAAPGYTNIVDLRPLNCGEIEYPWIRRNLLPADPSQIERIRNRRIEEESAYYAQDPTRLDSIAEDFFAEGIQFHRVSENDPEDLKYEKLYANEARAASVAMALWLNRKPITADQESFLSGRGLPKRPEEDGEKRRLRLKQLLLEDLDFAFKCRRRITPHKAQTGPSIVGPSSSRYACPPRPKTPGFVAALATAELGALILGGGGAHGGVAPRLRGKAIRQHQNFDAEHGEESGFVFLYHLMEEKAHAWDEQYGEICNPDGTRKKHPYKKGH